MRALIKKVALGSGALRLAACFQKRGVAILMYHSVLDDPTREAATLGGMIHSTANFRGQMELLARDFHPVSLDEVSRSIRADVDLPPRAVCVTFDDGYADNLEVATPILNRIGIQATFYFTVDSIVHRCLPWPARLRFAFRTSERKNWLDGSGNSWSLASAAEREDVFLNACDQCCKLSGSAQAQFVSRIERELNAHLGPESATLMMSIEQMNILLSQGHLVGSHTMTHPNMAQLSEKDADFELTESRRWLEQQVNAPVVHFSYPCPALSPHWSRQTVNQSRAAGYETAVTTDAGLVRRGDDLLALKRIRPTKSVDGLRWNLECAFAGRSM